MDKRKVFIRLDRHQSLRAYDEYDRQINVIWRYVSFDKFKVTIRHYDSEGYSIAGSSNEFNLTTDELDEYLDTIKEISKVIEVY